MVKLIIEGGTGTGKTYTAINMARQAGRFAYVAPCRLLAYETYVGYSRRGDRLKTGMAVIGGSGSIFATYGSVGDLSEYKTLVIDEAHWLTNDDSHSNTIKDLMADAERHGLNILLVTATRTFEAPDGFTVKQLSPLCSFSKQKVKFTAATDRAESGVKTLIVCSSIGEIEEWYLDFADDLKRSGVSCAIRTRKDAEHEIWKSFSDFAAGDLSCLITTNIAAQGINLPCENLIVDMNAYDDLVSAKQKLGRLGRYGITPDTTLTYALTCHSQYDSLLEDYGDDFDYSAAELVLWNVDLQARADVVDQPDYQPMRDKALELAIYKQAKSNWVKGKGR
ncbi:hypothetical protein VF14_18310 [Nostoc linckia z18]|uniref:Helicase n=2 Tax=Nostoc linckia TaxID=92942 RepID=A0A9Q6EJW5_NOSLI|nr:helicase-related protein [Nostoc linckia]PHJ53456.1 hypothetical protein VF02_37195 [Nostoc linckia z1]PHJ81976.1 hypothetical protein VF07_29220 [Nostoc linckia z6]PHJ92874.1 hypothetical protein VF04_27935 [Nostoc linckia z7]PHK00803.1 hypothetical protein VF08_23310 [Nostoc linckia z8]PHK09319.1 hypothetical protein VF09_15995 [Nostoc linckia z9]